MLIEVIHKIYRACKYGYGSPRIAKELHTQGIKVSYILSKTFEDITKREIEILQLTCMQYTAEEIGKKLFISVKTVNGHRDNLLQKTGSRNVTGLVIYAIKNNLVEIV